MIYIIRHGQTDTNKRNCLQGRSDNPLNTEGRKQAEAAGAFFSRKGITFSHVISSPLIRAVDTAKAVAGAGQIIHLDDRLLEMDYGPYEGVGLDNPPAELVEFFSDLVNNPAPAGMEQLDQVVTRTGQLAEELKALVLASGAEPADLDETTDLDKLADLDGLTDLDELACLDGLTCLDKLTDLDGLTDLDELTDLDGLAEGQELTDLDELTCLDKLADLDGLAEGQELTDLDGLTCLDKLADFDGLTDLDELACLDGLAEGQEPTGGNILISTHAIAMKGLLEYLTPDSAGSYWAKYLPNCGIYAFDIIDGQFTVPVEIDWKACP